MIILKRVGENQHFALSPDLVESVFPTQKCDGTDITTVHTMRSSYECENAFADVLEAVMELRGRGPTKTPYFVPVRRRAFPSVETRLPSQVARWCPQDSENSVNESDTLRPRTAGPDPRPQYLRVECDEGTTVTVSAHRRET